MVKETTVRRVGNSAGLTLPKAMLERFNLKEGDSVHLVETEEGILITPYDPLFKETMAAAMRGIAKYRNALRELAK